MHLINFPNIRVKQYKKGWVVEAQHKTWYGKRYWKHIISVAGINEEPWYYKTRETAIEEAKLKFEWELLFNNLWNQ